MLTNLPIRDDLGERSQSLKGITYENINLCERKEPEMKHQCRVLPAL